MSLPWDSVLGFVWHAPLFLSSLLELTKSLQKQLKVEKLRNFKFQFNLTSALLSTNYTPGTINKDAFELDIHLWPGQACTSLSCIFTYLRVCSLIELKTCSCMCMQG